MKVVMDGEISGRGRCGGAITETLLQCVRVASRPMCSRSCAARGEHYKISVLCRP